MEKKIQVRLIEDLNKFDLYPFIKELNKNLSQSNFQTYLQQMVNSGFLLAGAFIGDELVGLTGIWINTKFYCGKYLEIDNFVVNESHRGMGIGEEIVNFCINLAKEKNCQNLVLNAYIENEKAHKFYDKFGFKNLGIHRILSLQK